MPTPASLPYALFAARGRQKHGYQGLFQVPGEVSERLKEHAWKVCIRQRIAGSNPALSAK